MEAQRGHQRGMLYEWARQARREPTRAEKALREILRDHRCGGLGFRRQSVIGPFRLDFYCPSKKLAIEVDGSIHAEPEIERRDRDRQTILERDFALTFMRVTNEAVLKTPEKVLAIILAAAGIDTAA